MFAGLIAGAVVLQICRVRWGSAPSPNRQARQVGLALVGMAIGCTMSQANLTQAGAHLPIYLLLTLLSLLSGTAIAWLYARLSHSPTLEALLATVPGGMGVMAAIAADYGGNVAQVALVQITRVTSVIVLIPLAAGLMSGKGLNPRALLPHQAWLILTPTSLGMLAFALGLTGLGVAFAHRLKIPAASFLGAIVIGTLLNPLAQALALPTFTPPPLVGWLGQILLGITIGEYWASNLGERSFLTRRGISSAILAVVLTLVAGVAVAAVAVGLTSWDWLTCLLVASPGGAPEMILVALALDHQVETVTASHLVRLIVINSSLPVWLWLTHKFGQPSQRSTTEAIDLKVPHEV
jgi:membrane AbrB-like protein